MFSVRGGGDMSASRLRNMLGKLFCMCLKLSLNIRMRG